MNTKKTRQRTWQENIGRAGATSGENGEKIMREVEKDERNILWSEKENGNEQKTELVSELARRRDREREEIAAVSPAGLAVGRRDRLRFPIPSSLRAATQPRSATL